MGLRAVKNNENGRAVGFVLVLVLALTLAAAASYFITRKYFAPAVPIQKPQPSATVIPPSVGLKATPVEAVQKPLPDNHFPKICLIIDDGGYQRGEVLDCLYKLKVPVTLSIIPGAEFSKALAEEVPAHGVEVMCHMPMEGHEKGMVGKDYMELLKKGMSDSEAESEVGKALDNVPNCKGLNNHMGSVATVDKALMQDVCKVLKSRGLFLIDSRTTAQSVAEKVAQESHVPVAHRDVFLDNEENSEAILEQFNSLVEKARKNGMAVGIGHFKLTTLKTLEGAVQGLKDRGIQFVYASDVVKEE